MAIEIVSFPINSMVIFHSFLYVYQRLPDAIGTLDISSCVASKVADCSSSRQKMRQPKTFRATSMLRCFLGHWNLLLCLENGYGYHGYFNCRRFYELPHSIAFLWQFVWHNGSDPSFCKGRVQSMAPARVLVKTSTGRIAVGGNSTPSKS